MGTPAVGTHIDDVWLEYQALRSDNDRRVGVHATLCLHYAPLAKYMALRLMPTLNGNDDENPTLIATAWIELSRCIEDWTGNTEGEFRNIAITRVRDALVTRITTLNERQ